MVVHRGSRPRQESRSFPGGSDAGGELVELMQQNKFKSRW